MPFGPHQHEQVGPLVGLTALRQHALALALDAGIDLVADLLRTWRSAAESCGRDGRRGRRRCIRRRAAGGRRRACRGRASANRFARRACGPPSTRRAPASSPRSSALSRAAALRADSLICSASAAAARVAAVSRSALANSSRWLPSTSSNSRQRWRLGRRRRGPSPTCAARPPAAVRSPRPWRWASRSCSAALAAFAFGGPFRGAAGRRPRRRPAPRPRAPPAPSGRPPAPGPGRRPWRAGRGPAAAG